jgi:nucleoside-diphosphate-sugar epimerase
MATALVTGGAGFIGSHLVRGLLDEGHQVRVLDNFSSGRRENLDGLDIELVEADIRERAAVDRAVAGSDWVFHLAAMVSLNESMHDPVRCLETNLMASVGLLEASRQAGVKRVVLSSSCAVYGEVAGPVSETRPPAPVSPYAASKLGMEQIGGLYAQEFDLSVVSLRYFNVYGPGQRADSDYAAVIPQFIERLARQQRLEIHGDGQQTRDFVYVGDVVRANLLAAESGAAGGTFNIGSGASVSVVDLAQALQKLFGQTGGTVFGPPRAGDIRDSQADTSLTQMQLGFRTETSLEHGLAATVEWFVANHKGAKLTKGDDGGTKGGGQPSAP